jgi:hypothetical protein
MSRAYGLTPRSTRNREKRKERENDSCEGAELCWRRWAPLRRRPSNTRGALALSTTSSATPMAGSTTRLVFVPTRKRHRRRRQEAR